MCLLILIIKDVATSLSHLSKFCYQSVTTSIPIQMMNLISGLDILHSFLDEKAEGEESNRTTEKDDTISPSLDSPHAPPPMSVTCF